MLENQTYFDCTGVLFEINMMSKSIFLVVFGFLLGVAQSASITSLDNADTKSVAECQSCEYIMKFIRFQTLNKAQSVNAVKEKLKALFEIIPSSKQNAEYLSNIEKYIRMIRDGQDPQSICKTLLKCTTQQPGSPRITACQVCTAVVNLIKAELAVSNTTVQIIIKAVEALCALIGDVPVYKECKVILAEIKQIIEWIEQQLTPTDICERLGFCNKTIALVVSDFSRAQLSGNSSTLCNVCMMIVSAVDGLFENVVNKLQMVEDELNEVCDAMGDLADQCKSVVVMVVDELKSNVEYLESKLNPEKTCQALSLCSSSLNV